MFCPLWLTGHRHGSEVGMGLACAFRWAPSGTVATEGQGGDLEEELSPGHCLLLREGRFHAPGLFPGLPSTSPGFLGDFPLRISGIMFSTFLTSRYFFKQTYFPTRD